MESSHSRRTKPSISSSPGGSIGTFQSIPRGTSIPALLIVDPDPASRLSITECLERAGHCVRSAGSGEEALALARTEAPELLVTELALPDVSGLGLCRTLREEAPFTRLPILMVSASSAEMDRVVAFEVGVDDFLSKPFNTRELALRVAAILRRTRKASAPAQGEVLRHRKLAVDLAQHQVRVDDSLVTLTAREFDVLARMMRSAGRVLSRRQLLEEVWGTRSGKTPRVVDTHVKWIRRKLGPAGEYIETLRGVGYRFTDDDGSPTSSRPAKRELLPVTSVDRAS